MASETEKTETGGKPAGGKGAGCAEVRIPLTDSVMTSLKDRPVDVTISLRLEWVRYDGELRLGVRVLPPKLKRAKRQKTVTEQAT